MLAALGKGVCVRGHAEALDGVALGPLVFLLWVGVGTPGLKFIPQASWTHREEAGFSKRLPFA